MTEAMQFASTVVKAAAPATVSAGVKWAAVLCGLGLLVLLYVVTAVFSNHWNPRKLVQGVDGRASTSKFQWFLWLAVIVFAYTTLWVLRAAQGNFSALSETPTNLLWVLSLSTGTAAAAEGTTAAYVQSGRVTKQTSPAGATRPGIFQDDNGAPEVAKIQMVALTIITIGIFLAAVTRQIVSNQVASGLPDIAATLAVLMGISQVGYLGKKLVTSGPAAAPLRGIPDRPASVSPRGYSFPRWGGQQVRIRTFAVLVVGIVLAGFAIAALWYFSNPAGVTQKEGTSNLVSFAVQTLTLSAVVGFAAMATLETVKRLFHLRGRFFFGRLAGPEFLQLTPARPQGKSAKPLLPKSSARSDRKAGARRFDLPLEQLMAQLSYAADQALDQLPAPSKTESLDAPKLSPADKSSPGEQASAAPEQAPAAPAAPDKQAAAPDPSPTDGYQFLAKLVGDATLIEAGSDQTTLRIQTQAALDDLQVRVGNAWRWRLRLTSCVLAALFALGALLYVPVPPGSKTAALVGSFLIGGFLAGFFRDLVAIVERFRN